MRLVSITLAGLIVAVSMPAAWAAQKPPPPPQHHGMSKGDAFNYCRAQGYNRLIQMQECVSRKMHGG
jgi:putative hemolysin